MPFYPRALVARRYLPTTLGTMGVVSASGAFSGVVIQMANTVGSAWVADVYAAPSGITAVGSLGPYLVAGSVNIPTTGYPVVIPIADVLDPSTYIWAKATGSGITAAASGVQETT